VTSTVEIQDLPLQEMRLDEWPLRALAATLDLDVSGGAAFEFVPPLWHWLYFLSDIRRRDLGVDGHRATVLDAGARAERRMFAAARTEFHRPLRTNALAQMTETTLGTRSTTGKSGPLRIVTFEYRYLQAGVLCIREERDIVYRPPLTGGTAAVPKSTPARTAPILKPAAGAAAPLASNTVTPDAAMLFRFSALTFNAHRIHYDQHYAREQEGHAERVVQGPLTAVLLAELLRTEGISMRRFEFRARRPLFVDAAIRLTATSADDRVVLRASGPDGMTAMEAEAFR
jgi:3-methylfumaryl-CoA hydratase